MRSSRKASPALRAAADEVKRLLLFNDTRGIASEVLKGGDPMEVVRVAERLAEMPPSTAMILTGFFVGGKPETDGPPGALFLGAALASLGWRVVFVSREDCLLMLQECASFPAAYSEFPVESEAQSRQRSQRLLARYQPKVLISIEVCGRTAGGFYLNMRGEDIGAVTPRMDLLTLSAVERGIYSIGVGDGGNEVGFGCVPSEMVVRHGIEPCVVRTDALLVASVSNWAAYVLLLFLSRNTEADFLPDLQAEQRLLKRLMAHGAVDGFSGRGECKVDGRNARTRGAFLCRLQDFRRRL